MGESVNSPSPPPLDVNDKVLAKIQNTKLEATVLHSHPQHTKILIDDPRREKHPLNGATMDLHPHKLKLLEPYHDQYLPDWLQRNKIVMLNHELVQLQTAKIIHVVKGIGKPGIDNARFLLSLGRGNRDEAVWASYAQLIAMNQKEQRSITDYASQASLGSFSNADDNCQHDEEILEVEAMDDDDSQTSDQGHSNFVGWTSPLGMTPESPTFVDKVHFEVNDAVLVRWGRGRGRSYPAVVTCVDETHHATVQFDEDRTHARVPKKRIVRMAEAENLPTWLCPKSKVFALDPLATPHEGVAAQWHSATIIDARRGPERANEGLRLWIRYDVSGLCQWVRHKQVRMSKATVSPCVSRSHITPPVKKSRKRSYKTCVSVDRTSNIKGSVGTEVWILLDRQACDTTLRVYEVHFGALSCPASQISPSLLACHVPFGVAEGEVSFKVTATERKSTGDYTQESYELDSKVLSYTIVADENMHAKSVQLGFEAATQTAETSFIHGVKVHTAEAVHTHGTRDSQTAWAPDVQTVGTQTADISDGQGARNDEASLALIARQWLDEGAVGLELNTN